MSYNKTMRLSDIKKGERVVLKRIETDEKIALHLRNLGLVPGTLMDILLNSVNGTIVLVRDGKLALGRDIANAVEVDIFYGQRVC